MIHRYTGTTRHTFGLVSWNCTCEASGAVQYLTVEAAKADYPLHQRAAAAESCAWCDATADEVFLHPDQQQRWYGPFEANETQVWLCEDCYAEAMPKAELMEES